MYSGAPVYKAWTATHSFGACIQAAWAESMHIYQTWQGTYSACFLMALQPGIFGKYWLVPIILLGSLILSTYTLGYTILRRLLHISKLEYTFISTLFVLMTVQFVWSFYDAFCWYNGAMYYTLYYSISLFLASLLIEFHLTKSIIAKIIITLVSAALAIFIAGGNFVTGLVCQPFSLWQSYGCGWRGRRLLSSCFLSLSFMPALLLSVYLHQAILSANPQSPVNRMWFQPSLLR